MVGPANRQRIGVASAAPALVAQLLRSAELGDLTPSPPGPSPPMGARGESVCFSLPSPLWGRGRRGEAVLPVAPGEGVQVSPIMQDSIEDSRVE